ncbi:MAG: Hsp70 family protein [Litoreibacter sp.]|uniref:Hsp70 family protein n=1 Tax=Litoreibacter sp. TaxID=1969459 RepID=UPI00329852EA
MTSRSPTLAPTLAPTLGIDFGTSNSAAGYLRDGKPHLVEITKGSQTLPTTFFFDFDTRQTLIGEPANQALLDGDDGRFMRALKRVLGTNLMHESRQILNERVTFVDIIARFLRQIKIRAEADAGHAFEVALSGRPVVFHGVDDPREQQAEGDLRACYLAAGFKDVSFLPEPEAAAIASGALESSGELGLIVDIGGGTSDFSLFRSNSTGVSILANHGVRIGGTDFDRSISIESVMPLLGKGSDLRKVIGEGATPMPNAIFNDLATWEKIPFLYAAKTRRSVAEMAKLAYEPDKLGRLVTVLDDELGHELAFAVERGKIAANSGDANAQITLNQIERDLHAPLSLDTLTSTLQDHSQSLRNGAQETLRLANTKPEQVSKVIYVGGSSLMSMVSDTMKGQFPHAEHSFTEVFTAVTDGLALASAQQ